MWRGVSSCLLTAFKSNFFDGWSTNMRAFTHCHKQEKNVNEIIYINKMWSLIQHFGKLLKWGSADVLWCCYNSFFYIFYNNHERGKPTCKWPWNTAVWRTLLPLASAARTSAPWLSSKSYKWSALKQPLIFIRLIQSSLLTRCSVALRLTTRTWNPMMQAKWRGW